MTSLYVQVCQHSGKATPTEAEFMDEIQTKVLIVFLLVIHSHLYSFALRFLFLQTYATSVSVKDKGV